MSVSEMAQINGSGEVEKGYDEIYADSDVPIWEQFAILNPE